MVGEDYGFIVMGEMSECNADRIGQILSSNESL